MWSKGAVCLTVLVALCQASTIKRGSKDGSTTSATISVQRFGGNTFYNFLQAVPSTVSPSNDDDSSVTETTEWISSTAVVSTTLPAASSDSSSSSSEESGESERELVSRASQDDAQVLETTIAPAQAPVVSNDAGGDGEAVPAPAPPEAVGPVEGENLPSDQTPLPPPAEAVPGQPGEHDADTSSSSSSSEEASSSSSSEELREAYSRKVWEYSKVKSKDSLLLARLNSKLLARKQKANNNKYSY